MKKIIFTNIPMQLGMNSINYKDEQGNPATDFETCFPVTIVISKYVKKDDNVKIVMIKKQDIEKNCEKNINALITQINSINKKIGANIEFCKIEIEFDEGRQAQEKLLTQLVEQIDIGAEVYADITYGTKSLPILVFAAFNFAEKFYGCKVSKVVYGRVDFAHTKAVQGDFCNVTNLYYINALTNTMESETPEKAKKMLDTIIAM